jgi:hypothetical protein
MVNFLKNCTKLFLDDDWFLIFNTIIHRTLFSDARGLVSSPIDAGELTTLFLQANVNGRRQKPEPVILSHIKLQLIKSIELKKSNSIQQWLVVLGRTLASFGLYKYIYILPT